MAGIEPITGMLSRNDDFDLDGDGTTSPDERAVFNALNADIDPGPDYQFLTFRDADLVARNFTPARRQAVERLLTASETYRERHASNKVEMSWSYFKGALKWRTGAQNAAQLAYAMSPPGSDVQQRAGVQLRKVEAQPRRADFPGLGR